MSLSNRTFGWLRDGIGNLDAAQEIESQLGVFTFGTKFYVNPDASNASDNNLGTSKEEPLSTVLAAYNKTTSGAHDIIYLSANSAHTISATLAVSKSRVHFVGTGGGGRWEGQRTRFESTITTGTGIAQVTVTGVGCTFHNIKFRDTSTNSTNVFAVADGGEFTMFENCSFEKDEDLNQTGAAELLCNGDTSLYRDCSIGNGIYIVSVARANILFTRVTIAGKVARSVRFVGCLIENKTSATTSLHAKATTNDIERHCIFDDCIFWTAVLSTATQADSFGIASALTDGMILLKNCVQLNVTDYCATGLGVYHNSPAAAAEGGEAILVADT